MKFEDLKIKFSNVTPYIFYFENVHLLLLSYERDDAKFIYRIKEQTGTDITLDFPGETFTERVLDTVSKIFFIQVQEEGMPQPSRYVLGSYFELDRKIYGAYYQREVESPEVVLFRLDGEAPDFELTAIEDTEYEKVAEHFMENFT